MKVLIADILESKAQTIVNTVNCVGIMGKGIALEFKRKFPDMFKDYAEKCKMKSVKLGVPYIYRTLFPPNIINFPTKDHWKSLSKIVDIEKGLDYLLEHYKEWGVTSIAVPPLGCGNGQLEWKNVGPVIYKRLKKIDIPVELYAPFNTPPKELTIEFLENNKVTVQNGNTYIPEGLNPAWITLVEILYRIEQQPYHWPVGRTIFQKIAYVATTEGLPTDLEYQKGSYGPYGKLLKIVTSKLINNNLLKEEHSGNMFIVKTGSNYPFVRKKYTNYFQKWAGLIDKTTDLFMRLNTMQAEVLATVLFSANELGHALKKVPSELDVLEAVMHWKQKRRPPLKKIEVASMIRNLGMLKWLSIKPDSNLPLPAEEAFSV